MKKAKTISTMKRPFDIPFHLKNILLTNEMGGFVGMYVPAPLVCLTQIPPSLHSLEISSPLRFAFFHILRLPSRYYLLILTVNILQDFPIFAERFEIFYYTKRLMIIFPSFIKICHGLFFSFSYLGRFYSDYVIF